MFSVGGCAGGLGEMKPFFTLSSGSRKDRRYLRLLRDASLGAVLVHLFVHVLLANSGYQELAILVLPSFLLSCTATLVIIESGRRYRGRRRPVLETVCRQAPRWMLMTMCMVIIYGVATLAVSAVIGWEGEPSVVAGAKALQFKGEAVRSLSDHEYGYYASWQVKMWTSVLMVFHMLQATALSGIMAGINLRRRRGHRLTSGVPSGGDSP